jgi:ComF family protein
VLIDGIISLVWPARCAGCGTFVAEGTSFCASCRSTLVPLFSCCPGCAMPLEVEECTGCRTRPFPFVRAGAALAYGGALAEALLRFKHGGQRHLAVPLARYLAPIMSAMLDQVDVLCPVPLHPRRLRKRGFNQALEILRESVGMLPKERRRRLVPDSLARKIDTPTLGRGSPAARAHAVAGAFVVPGPAEICSRHVLVIDDVMTTGATLAECARTLLAAGAARVSVAVLARAI